MREKRLQRTVGRGRRDPRAWAVLLAFLMIVAAGSGSAGLAADGAAGTFKDVSPSHWGYETIRWGVERGIAAGFPDGTFRPDESVSEEQFLALWLRANGYPRDSRPGEAWSDPYYELADAMLLPVDGNRAACSTRERVAEVSAAYHGLYLRGADAIRHLLDAGWSLGRTAPTVEGYQGGRPLTRAEAVQFIRNVLESRANQDPVPLLTEDERTMFRLVNEERVQRGLEPLELDPDLVRVARLKSRDIVDNGYFDHTSPTYGSPFEMMERFGIAFRAAGENLAGNPSVEDAHRRLMESPGHRANILNENYTRVGIGVAEGGIYGKVYTQLFVGK